MNFAIGQRVFRTKGDATREVRRILHESPLDLPLDGQDGDLIADLYARHPRTRVDPLCFSVGINNYHGTYTRGFRASFADGSQDRFSYLPCLSPNRAAPSLLAAMRAAVLPSQREALRNEYTKKGRAIVPCHFCAGGLQLSQAQAHHLPPKFVEIANGFVGLIGMPDVQSGDLGDEFTDIEIKKRWIMFHDSVAQRVIVCAKCNAEDERLPLEPAEVARGSE